MLKRHPTFWLVILCVLVGYRIIGSKAALPGALSPSIQNPANGHEYYLLTNANWSDSEATAKFWGGHLATIRNQAEQDWILGTFGSYKGQQRLLWIGLNDLQQVSQFTWASGEPVTYTNWANGEPNNAGGDERFVALYYPLFNQPGAWNDWNNRSTDPIGLPFNGVVEIIPQLLVSRFPDGRLEIGWPRSLDYYLEATPDLGQPFTTFSHPRQADIEKGLEVAIVSPTEARLFFRLRHF